MHFCAIHVCTYPLAYADVRNFETAAAAVQFTGIRWFTGILIAGRRVWVSIKRDDR